MKKVLLSLMMAVTAIGASAQNTYNVRVGGVVMQDYYLPTVMGQANFSLKNGSLWTFSPAVQFSTDLYNISALAHFNIGYRTIIGDHSLFVPKIGIALGHNTYDFEYEGSFLVGPSIDLAFELKHFVIGLTGFYSITKAKGDWYGSYDNPNYYDDAAVPMVSLTLGYTF